MADALVDTVAEALGRLRNASARMRLRRAEHTTRQRCPHIVAPLKEAVLFVENAKEAALACNPLRRPEEEITARLQRVVECSHQPVLQSGVQIDQQIAARYKVEPRKRRVPGNIVYREDAHLADVPDH